MKIVKAENKHYGFPGFFNVLIVLVSLIENFAGSLSVWCIQKKVVLFSCVSVISKKRVGSPADIKLKLGSRSHLCQFSILSLSFQIANLGYPVTR